MSPPRSLTFPSGDERLNAYYACPEGLGPFPGVVVIHEVFGLTENIKDITQRFADAGYAALAVDLFTGRNRVVCMVRFLVDMFTNAFDHGGIHDLKAALTFLAEQPEVDAEKLGAIGFCLGGGFAVAWACTDERLKVIAPYYGANPRPLEAVARSCPVVGSYPSRDFTAKSGRKLEAALTQYDVAHDIKIYEGAKHSFFNDRSGAYDADAATDSWQRVLNFFQTHIKPASTP
ncbi:MAG: dienelactone hydrolase family protein [Leptolyngbya sp. BL-A-14]